MVGLQRSVPVLRAAPALGWNTPLTIGTGPLAITIGTIHSASGLDASSYAEALPTLSLSPK